MKIKSLKWMAILLSGATLVTSCSFSSKTSRAFLEESIKNPYDAIIVPGVPFEDGKWSNIMKARVYWSIYLYEHGITENTIYSGSAVYSPYYESEIMALYAKELGIPEENIFTEKLAEHSTENIFYGYRKAKQLGFDRVALATDPFQAKMLRKYVKKIVSPEVGFLPIIFDTLKKMEPIMVDPKISSDNAFVQNFTPLDESESFFERFRGTRGLKVDTTAYSN
ncbi:MAG: YdcF family protein [Bacteroidales bacterium]|nr:YdcF family protein [Bacteroidales bacterium]